MNKPQPESPLDQPVNTTELTAAESLLLSRRAAIRNVVIMLGGTALVGGNALLAACTSAQPLTVLGATPFSATDIAYLDEVAETILPATSTPGAKAAGVGPFIALMVTDTYSPADQQIFRTGLRQLEQACVDLHGHGYMEADAPQRLALLEQLDQEQKTYMDSKAGDAPSHYFRMLKELTLLGFFTSEVGCTQAMRYIETPGQYEPCVPWSPGEPAWAAHA